MTYNTIDNDVTMAGGEESALLANRYRIVKQLGQGGMGSVWLAEDTQLDNKFFAIKMLPSMLVSNKRAYRQLKDEALVAMKLVHPNIVTLRAFEENNGNPFLVMDYIEGQTLDNCLEGWGNLSEEATSALLKPIAEALDYAHSQGVVHRDVKPGNVMVRSDGTPFILDFGIAREVQESMTHITGRQSSGTLLYMSPEQLNGDAPKPAQDVYSFAAMAYECIKGAPPFNYGNVEYQIMNKEPEPRPALAKDPAQRFATYVEFVEARTMGEGSSAQSVSLVSKMAAIVIARRGVIVKTICAVAFLVVGIVGWCGIRWFASKGENSSVVDVAQREQDVLNEHLQSDWIDILPELNESDVQEQERKKNEQERMRTSTREFLAAFKEGRFDAAGSLIDSVDSDNPDVQSCLAAMYMEGVGVGRDYAKAFLYCEKIARLGDVGAKYTIGEMYDKGLGVAENEYAAVKWYEEAAQEGYAPAQYCLGVMYENGRGVRKSVHIAKSWYMDAAKQGNDDAKVALRRLEQSEDDRNEKLNVDKDAVDEGSAHASSADAELKDALTRAQSILDNLQPSVVWSDVIKSLREIERGCPSSKEWIHLYVVQAEYMRKTHEYILSHSKGIKVPFSGNGCVQMYDRKRNVLNITEQKGKATITREFKGGDLLANRALFDTLCSAVIQSKTAFDSLEAKEHACLMVGSALILRYFPCGSSSRKVRIESILDLAQKRWAECRDFIEQVFANFKETEKALRDVPFGREEYARMMIDGFSFDIANHFNVGPSLKGRLKSMTTADQEWNIAKANKENGDYIGVLSALSGKRFAEYPDAETVDAILNGIRNRKLHILLKFEGHCDYVKCFRIKAERSYGQFVTVEVKDESSSDRIDDSQIVMMTIIGDGNSFLVTSSVYYDVNRLQYGNYSSKRRKLEKELEYNLISRQEFDKENKRMNQELIDAMTRMATTK